MGKEKDNKCTDNSIDGAKLASITIDADSYKDKLIFIECNDIQKSFAKRMAEVKQEDKQKIVDSFAGQVLQGMTAGFYSMDHAHGWKPEDIAKECYDIAEAMYKERSKRNE